MVYEIREATAEIEYSDANRIKPGIAQEYCIEKSGNGDTDLIASFNTLEEAKKELSKYHSSVVEYPGYYYVTEYFIEEAEYDDDGDWISGGDIWAYSNMDMDWKDTD